VIQKSENFILIDVQGISYTVFIPAMIMQRLDDNLTEEGTIKLVTYHYLQVEPAKSTPILIGFSNQVEKDFFEQFITVSGIGPRAAMKALNQPISLIAKAIDEADLDFLETLPGIGQQRAREIVAKLQGKVGKYALIQDKEGASKETKKLDLEDEALEVLSQLQYKKSEAKEMIHKALNRRADISTVEDLLNEVYRQSKRP
jgi:Holliday junction DNA helicase RuvA